MEKKNSIICVSAAVIQSSGMIFAAQRKDAGPLALKWEFPGGKVEPGEDPAEAVVREIKEELSIQIDVLSHLTTVKHAYETFYLEMNAYLCKIVSGKLRLNEHIDAKWLSKSELYTVDWAAADLPIVELMATLMR